MNLEVLPPKPEQPIALHVFAGLHGAGKTSYIQHCIDHCWPHEKLGIILGEEGARKLDFSRTVPARVERILNACVCCEMAYGFFDIVVQFLRAGDIQRIVVEVGAQADVQQIQMMLQNSHLRDYVSFAPLHVLIDARNPHMRPESPAPLVRRLMQQADVFVLNFHDAPEARAFAGGKKPVIKSGDPPITGVRLNS